MARSRFIRNSAGAAAILNSPEVAAMVRSKAEEVAGQVITAQPADVVVDSYTTDRAAASVTIRHKDAKAWQARDGILTRAAAAVGLEVRERR